MAAYLQLEDDPEDMLLLYKDMQEYGAKFDNAILHTFTRAFAAWLNDIKKNNKFGYQEDDKESG